MKFVVAVCSFVLLVVTCALHVWSAETNRTFCSASSSQALEHRGTKLPKALESIPLDRLSSGALRLLDQGGNLIQRPSNSSFALEAAALSADPGISAVLDPRVGAN